MAEDMGLALEHHQLEADNERLEARDAEWAESQARAVTRYAQARALLVRWVGLKDEDGAEWEYEVFHATNDFLADKEPSDGE